MSDDIKNFFENMKEEDLQNSIPSFEESTKKPASFRWLYGIAAVITIVAMALIFTNEDELLMNPQVVLDTRTTPSVTNTLTEPESEEFLDWEAPSDYLSNDFNP